MDDVNYKGQIKQVKQLGNEHTYGYQPPQRGCGSSPAIDRIIEVRVSDLGFGAPPSRGWGSEYERWRSRLVALMLYVLWVWVLDSGVSSMVLVAESSGLCMQIYRGRLEVD
jgi:hypothetical protein